MRKTSNNTCEFNFGGKSKANPSAYIDAVALDLGAFILPELDLPSLHNELQEHPTIWPRNSTQHPVWLYFKGPGMAAEPTVTHPLEVLGRKPFEQTLAIESFQLELVEAGGEPGKGSIVMCKLLTMLLLF